jgi:adenylate cyclase class IV
MNPTDIAKRIRVLRGQLVLLDVDLADLYDVVPERLVDLVRKNQPKLSVEFAFSIEPNEIRDLESRVAALAFTEHGVIIAASMLNSPRAVTVSVQVVRAFVKLRDALPSDTEFAGKIEALEKMVATLDAKTRKQFEEVYRAIRKLSAPTAPIMRSDRELH